MLRVKLIAAGVLALLLLILIVQNSEVVSLRLLFWEFQMSRVVLILLTAIAGFVCGYLVAGLGALRSRNP